MQQNARQTHFRLGQGIGAILGLCLSLLSGLSVAQQPDPLKSKRGAIEGSVVLSHSGKPLQGAGVSLRLLNSAPATVVGGGPVPPPTQWSTTTDQRGHYEFRDLVPGHYSLLTQMPGYGVRERIRFEAQIRLSAGEKVTGVDIEMTPQMSMSGRAVDQAGMPIPHVGVTVLQERYDSGRKQLYPIQAGQANERGEFEFAGVWTGPIVVAFSPIRMWQPTPTGVTEAAPNMAYATTYYPGTIDVSQAARIDVPLGGQRRGLEGRVLKAPVSRIRGRVQDHTGRLPSRCSLILKPTTPAWNSLLHAHVREARDGAFEFEHVHPGSYRLIVQLLGRGTVHRELIQVGSQNIDELNVRLPSPVQVAGEILLEAGIELDPTKLLVSLQPVEEGIIDLPRARMLTADGTKFVFDDVSPGRYRITASLLRGSSPAESVYVERIQYGDREVTDTPVEIATRPAPIRVELNSGTGSLTGMVMKNNAPAPRATVLLLSTHKFGRLNQRWPISAWTYADARFEIERLPPGDYLAFAFEEIEPDFWRDEERFRQFERGARKISIAKKGAVSANLEVMPLPEG